MSLVTRLWKPESEGGQEEPVLGVCVCVWFFVCLRFFGGRVRGRRLQRFLFVFLRKRRKQRTKHKTSSARSYADSLYLAYSVFCWEIPLLKEVPDLCARKPYFQSFAKQIVCFVKSSWSVVNFLIIFERDQSCWIKLRPAEIITLNWKGTIPLKPSCS